MATALIVSSFGLNARTNEGLSNKNRAIVSIAAYAARGELDGLKLAIGQGLDAGLTVAEAREILVHLYAYTGFPRSLNGITTLMTVLEERKAAGKIDAEGREASLLTDTASAYERGRRTIEKITGVPQTKPAAYGQFAPRIDRFLKEHLFADLFDSDVLDIKTRQLVTISALTAIDDVELQRRNHYRNTMHVGATQAEMDDMTALVTKIRQGRMEEMIVLPAQNFTGTAFLVNMLSRDERSYTTGTVAFTAGARTNWHTHPAGQILLVTEGEGLYQEEGKPARVIRKGDIVNIPARVKHWHGASAYSPMTHVAITNYESDKGVDWLEPVTEDQFSKANADTKK